MQPAILPFIQPMQHISNLSLIADRYDGYLLDLWGVIHDGSHLYPGVHDTLVKMSRKGKKIIFVSNAPRRTAKATVVLTELGIEPELYNYAITSGELGYQWLASGKAPWGKRYYYIGPAKDADILDGLDFKRVDDIKQADFLLNVGFGSDDESSEDWRPLFRAARALNLPMLCHNPDFEVVKISGERYPCAGVLADEYARAGGSVKYFGKPFPEVYEQCLEWFKPIQKQRILAVGDGITTDIAGAVNFGFDAALVTGGIIKKDANVEELCRNHDAIPTYIMPAFNW